MNTKECPRGPLERDVGRHTPGPWRYCRTNGSPTTGQHMIAGAKPGYLAEVRDCGSGDVVANARLIEAAPDLLAALIELRDWYSEHTGLPAASASAAVAKALGVPPNASYTADAPHNNVRKWRV